MYPSAVRVAPLCALGLFLLTAACTRPSASPEGASVKPAGDRQTAPEFTLKDIDGKTVKLSDYAGDVVLLNFWATWCAPCKFEIPWFTEFEQKHKDDGFAVLGVSMDEGGWEDVKPYVERARVNYRVLMGTDEVAMMYGGVEALPTSFLIDRQGRIASVHVGLVSKSDYENDIHVLLNDETSAAERAAGVGAVLVGAN